MIAWRWEINQNRQRMLPMKAHNENYFCGVHPPEFTVELSFFWFHEWFMENIGQMDVWMKVNVVYSKKMWQWALKHRHALIIIYIAFHIGYSIWIRNHKYTISLHIFGPHRRGRQWKTDNWVCRESSLKIRKFTDTQTQYKHTISTEK